MRTHDSDEAVHYADPPYVHETRSLRTRAPAYRHEMDNTEHEALASALSSLRGRVILSGIGAHCATASTPDGVASTQPLMQTVRERQRSRFGAVNK